MPHGMKNHASDVRWAVFAFTKGAKSDKMMMRGSFAQVTLEGGNRNV